MNKSDDTVGDAAQLEYLSSLNRNVVNDPSFLNQNFRQVCAFLGTQYHDRADQVIGTMIAYHSSRMISTLWTVLLQCLREASNVRAQLCLLHHFSNVADRIIISQRQAAFRVFSRETLRLLSDIDDVITSHSFITSFCTVVGVLGVYAEREMSKTLFEKILDYMIACSRAEGNRASALLASQLVANTLYCGSFMQLIEAIEAKCDVLKSCIVMDACLPFLIRQAKKLSSTPHIYQTVCYAKTQIEKWVLALVFETPLRHQIIPVVISCYEKLKQFDPIWQLISAEKIVQRVISILPQRETKTILVLPFLNLMQLLDPNWTDEIETIWILTEHSDPMIRFEALRTISIAAKNIHSQIARKVLKMTCNLFSLYMGIQCSYTISGVLCLLAALAPKLYFDDLKILYNVLRSAMKFSNPVNLVSSVRISVLQLIGKLSSVCSDVFYYVMLCTEHLDRKVRNQAYSLLLQWSNEFIMDKILFKEPFFRRIDFFEGVSYKKTVSKRASQAWLIRFRNIAELVLHWVEHLNFGMENTYKQRQHIIQCASEGFIFIGSFSPCSSLSSSLDSILLEDTFYNAFLSLQDLLLSTNSFSSDVYISLVNASVACLRRCGTNKFFDIIAHKKLLDYIWNVIYRCCKSIDPLSNLKLHKNQSLYLAWKPLSDELENMIISSAISGLRNAKNYRESHFFDLVECVTVFFFELVRIGSCSSVFITNLRCLYGYIFDCLDIMAGLNPIVSLIGSRLLFEALFCNNNTEPNSCQDNAKISTESTMFISRAVTILKRSLSFDLAFVGEHFFGFIKLIIQTDNRYCDAKCYLVVDEDFLLVKRMISIVSDKSYYNAVQGASLVEIILSVLELLLSSCYSSRVMEICKESEWRVILVLIDEFTDTIQGDAFGVCKDTVLRILELYCKKNNKIVALPVLNWENLLNRNWRDTEEFLSEFYKLCEDIVSNDFVNYFEDSLTIGKMSLPSTLCACVLNPSLVNYAVELALTTEAKKIFLELLLIILLNVDTNIVVKSATFLVGEPALGPHDDLLAHIIDSFCWGWVECDGSSKTMEFIADDRCSFTLRRALYDAVESSLLTFPESLKSNIKFLEVAFSFFPQINLLKFDDNDRNVSLGAVSETLLFCQGILSTFEQQTTCFLQTTEGGILFAGIFKLPLFLSGLSQSPRVFLHLLESRSRAMVDLLECVSEGYAKEVFLLMGKQGLLALLNAPDMIEMTKLMIRDNVTSLKLDIVVLSTIVERIFQLLSEASEEDECISSLKYCSMFFLVLLSPSDEYGWQEVLDGKCAVEEVGRLQVTVLSIINRCLNVDLMDIKSVAMYVVSSFLYSPSSNSGFDESILWLVVKCCMFSVWHAIIGNETYQLPTTASLKFLLKLNQTVGLPPSLVLEMHARYTPLLLTFGRSSRLGADEDRYVFWLVTSFLLHSVILEERYSKPKVHMALVDSLYQYADFPLGVMSSETLSAIRSVCDASVFPSYAQLCVSPDERQWNIHITHHILPLCGRYTQSRNVAEKILTSLLHLYVHVVASVFTNASTLPVYCVSDTFFTLTTLSLGNVSLLRQSQAYEGTIAANILPYLYAWYREYAASCVDSAHVHSNVLRFHVGLLPDSNKSILLLDGWNTYACTTIMLSLFTVGNEKSKGYVDAGLVISKLLKMDIFSYMNALTAIIIVTGLSARKRIEPMASILVHRLFDDLESIQWGDLSLSFAILQMMRGACSILSALSDEHFAKEIFEAVWNGVIKKNYSRRLEHYAYYTMQCVAHVTTVGQSNWCKLRAILSDFSHDRGQCDTTGLNMLQVGNSEKSVFTKSIFCSTSPRRVPLLLPKSPIVSKLYKNRSNLFCLLTSASLVLRCACSEVQAEELNFNRVQVRFFLDFLSHTSLCSGNKVPFIVHELMSHVFEQEDTFFIVLNGFDFTFTARRLLVNELYTMSMRVMRENAETDSRWCAVTYTTRLLFETCLAKDSSGLACCWWWMICAIINSFLCIHNPELSHVITVILVKLPTVSAQRMLALEMTHYLSQEVGYGEALSTFLAELREMCFSRQLGAVSCGYVMDVLSTLLRTLHS